MDDVVKEVRDLLRTSMGSRCAAYYAGDVGIPYQATFPVLIVRENSTKHSRPSTSKDQYVHSLSILVITSIVASFKEVGITDLIIKHRETLRLIMEEKDASGAPKTDTVLGTLMKQANISGTNFVYNMNASINYRVPAPEGTLLVAAELTIESITNLVLRTA